MLLAKLEQEINAAGIASDAIFYGSAAELNTAVNDYHFRDGAKMIYITRMTDGRYVDGRERASVSIMVLAKRDWDATSREVADIQEECRMTGDLILHAILYGNSLYLTGDTYTQYIYSKTDDILCGMAFLVEIEETQGICR